MSLRVVTANVNGIRATARRGGLQWLAESGADVICLQEVRATTEQLMSVLDSSVLSHWHAHHAPAPELGRSGVAVLSREAPSAVRIDVKVPDIDGQGRWIECDFDSRVGPVTVVSTYIHSGEVDTPKQVAKRAFLTGADKRLATLARLAKRNGREALVCGDFNIGHREVDIKNWKGNRGKSGFLPEESARIWMAGFLGRGQIWGARWEAKVRGRTRGGPGVAADLTPTAAGALTTKSLPQSWPRRARSAVVGKAATYAERWSDHAPLTVDFR